MPTIGIYCIEHTATGRKYIGKSSNIEHRISSHKCSLQKSRRDKKCTNPYLYAAVQKYGWNAFTVRVLESFPARDDALLAIRELHWIDHYKTCDKDHGFNLRRDSSSGMVTHDNTRLIISMSVLGERNPNHGNYWSDEQKSRMSCIAKCRHASGVYGDGWRRKISAASTEMMKDPTMRRKIAKGVSKAMTKYRVAKYSREGELVEVYDSVIDAVTWNPGYKWQNIHSACDGHKPTYMNFLWRKVPIGCEVPARPAPTKYGAQG